MLLAGNESAVVLGREEGTALRVQVRSLGEDRVVRREFRVVDAEEILANPSTHRLVNCRTSSIQITQIVYGDFGSEKMRKKNDES